MHMSDALLSAETAATFWLLSAGAVAVALRRTTHLPSSTIPMGSVLGAFLFAAQMINFAIPGTGSSGHLTGGMLLAILIGPYQALLAIGAVLTIQALFFADGGLLALGANLFNMGVIPCLIVYPLLFQPLAGTQPQPGKQLRVITFLTALLALLLGALAVVLETWFSGLTALPLNTFLWSMGSIHLAIGVVEGIVTMTIVELLLQARPQWSLAPETPSTPAWGKIPTRLAVAALLLATLLSWFASSDPDGLEWSVSRSTSQHETPTTASPLHHMAANLQSHLAPMPDYAFPTDPNNPPEDKEKQWGSPDPATSLAGVVGGLLTLVLLWSLFRLLQHKTTDKHP
ncbi:MAG: energy-coupling factor ABC transporter permease [Magnetococcales bacterium]|nr:energy-coupling factor ABC transporter permease [Magnetococcales bacterium]MBF0116152.1 energy-coupling factor ABC transporter permease [Magnetococcales bacterium]